MHTARELFARAADLERRAKQAIDPSTTLTLLAAAQNLRRVAARLKRIEDDPIFRMYVGRRED